MSEVHQKGLQPWESEALKQLSRTLVVIADMLDGLPLDRILEDVAFEAAKKGHATKPFCHSPVQNRLLNVEKFAMALRAAQRVSRRDIKCQCGHGFSLHQTPGSECIGAGRTEPSTCECDWFIVHRYEYVSDQGGTAFPDGSVYLPCLCSAAMKEEWKKGVGCEIHPECPIHNPTGDAVKAAVESWRR